MGGIELAEAAEVIAPLVVGLGAELGIRGIEGVGNELVGLVVVALAVGEGGIAEGDGGLGEGNGRSLPIRRRKRQEVIKG